MPAKNPRVDLVRKRLEASEDAVLLKVGKARKRTLVRSAALTHDEVWRASRVTASVLQRRPS